MEASRHIPSKEIIRQTADNDYYLFKTDILAGLVSYSTDKNSPVNLETISTWRAKQIIEMNKRGEKPLSLTEDGNRQQNDHPTDLLADADISRFDKSRRNKKNKGGRNRGNGRNNQGRHNGRQTPRDNE